QSSVKRIEFYVATAGSDDASGEITAPFATLPRAVEALREMRSAGNSEPGVIYLRDGRHQLAETLVLGIDDGRTTVEDRIPLTEPGAGESAAEAHLTIAAYPDERPILSSGVPVDGWEPAPADLDGLSSNAQGQVWVADIPAGMDRFYTLYDSQGRLNRARQSGFFPSEPGDKRTLHFPPGAMKNWSNLSDVEVQVRPSRAWVVNMLPLESVDEEKGIARTRVSATYNMSALSPYLQGKVDASAWVENVLDALDEPGEWVVNSAAGKVYLWPRDPSDNGTPQGILAPALTELIRVEGETDYDGEADIPVRGIAFEGITFTHADRRAWTDDEDRLGWGMQHDWDMFDRPTAMLRFRGAEECNVSNSRFINSGGSGVRLDLHAQRNKVENNEFAHLGEAGIILAGYGLGTKDVNHHNDINNNHIHHFSEITWHSPGIWAWQSGHNHIAHNLVTHSGYSAVLITNRVTPNRPLNGEGGRTVRQEELPDEIRNITNRNYDSWKLREKYIHARHNLLEYNEITHSVQKLSDGNAIYVSGAGTGNVIRYNYIHDNLSHHLPAPIRCDDDQHETVIHGNVLYKNRAFAAGIASKGVNDISNNFIVEPLVAPMWGYVSFEWVPVPNSKVYHNIIVSHPDGGNAHAERLRRDQTTGGPLLVETDMDSNLYFHPTNPHWVDEHLEKMRAAGNEETSLFADPMFVDPASGDFTFKQGSPALELGIEELDVSKMGLLNGH
ncbi:right-handed parallel beta-helix repeat-containing protein, partial [Pseudomonadota bacterium]